MIRRMKKFYALSLAALLAACGGGGADGGGSTPPPQAAPTIHINVPTSPVLQGGPPLRLTASVSNGAAPTWTLGAGAPGKLTPGSDGNSILYEPPAVGVSANTQVTIMASAGGASAQYEFTLYPPPGSPGLSLITGIIGQRDFIDGKGTTAAFHAIQSIIADGADGYFVLDANTEKLAIRKVSAGGEVSTLYSSSGSYGYSDPWFNRSERLALASDGALYVLEQSSSGKRLLRFGANAAASVVLSGAPLDKVHAIVRAGGGAIYLVAPRGLTRLTADGARSVFAGDPDADFDAGVVAQDGSGATARFSFISAIGSDTEGNVLLRDGELFRRVSAAGMVTSATLPGLADIRTAQIAGARDGSFRLLADQAPARVHKVTPSNDVSLVFQETGPSVLLPSYIALGSGNQLLLAQRSELRQTDGAALTRNFAGAQDFFGFVLDGPAAEARFSKPDAIASDLAGNLYVSDHPGKMAYLPGEPGTRGFTLRKITPGGQVSSLFSTADTGKVSGMAVGRDGTIYFSDLQQFGSHGALSGSAVYKATPDGKVTVLAGCPPSRACPRGIVDGTGANATFAAASLIGMDAADNLYVTDNYTAPVIRKVAPDGSTTTISALPAGVGAAPDGNTYVIRDRLVVRRTPDGKETVVAGTEGSTKTILTGTGSFHGPFAITPIGPRSLAVISGEAIVKLVLPP